MLLRAVWQLCVRRFNEQKYPNHSTFTSVLHPSLTSPWDPLRRACRWKTLIRVLFSLSDWTHVLAIHAGKPVFHFYLFKVRKNKNLRGVELKI